MLIPIEVEYVARTMRWYGMPKAADRVERDWAAERCPVCEEVWPCDKDGEWDDECPLYELRRAVHGR